MKSPTLNPLDTSSGRGVGGNIIDPFGIWDSSQSGYNAGDMSGMPQAPGFVQAYDPATMSLTDYLQGKYDSSGLDAYKQQAMRTGPSAWANMATQDQAALANQSLEHGASQNNAQTAQAVDNLAARGGLSSGARERAGQEGAKNFMAMSQDTARQKNLNTMQIGMNDEQNRIQQLSALPGMEQQQAQMWEGAKQQDVANTMNANNAANAYNQNLYNQQMSAWGAGKQADATAAAGKHGFLGMGK